MVVHTTSVSHGRYNRGSWTSGKGCASSGRFVPRFALQQAFATRLGLLFFIFILPPRPLLPILPLPLVTPSVVKKGRERVGETERAADVLHCDSPLSLSVPCPTLFRPPSCLIFLDRLAELCATKNVCVCACVCARVRAPLCVCVCARACVCVLVRHQEPVSVSCDI